MDTLIIGGGAAGLAAAAELAAQGRTAKILEARDRLGGRVFTRFEPGVPIPLELGAEFIHGTSRVTFEWLNRARTLAVDASQVRWELENGRLRPTKALFEEGADVRAKNWPDQSMGRSSLRAKRRMCRASPAPWQARCKAASGRRGNS